MDKKAFYAWVGKDSRNKSLKDYGVDDKTIALFDRRLRASVEYANTSKRVLSAVEEAKQAPKNNKVDVLSDGGDKENQTSTKVDLKILINGRESAKRLLSVKAGDVAQFGQVGGHNFENINEFFSTTLGIVLPDNLRSYFYDVSTKGDEAKQQKQHNYENGFQMAYANALRQVKARASKSESDFIQDVYKGLMYHLTRNEPGVEMVILDPDGKKAFSELSFGPEFKEALEELSLYVVETGGTEGFGIAIYGFPQGAVAKKYVPSRKDADSKLIELRSQLTKSFNVRNRVGMGNLLKKIADIETQLERQSQHQQNQQQHQPAQQQHHQQTQQNRDNKIVPNNTNGQPDALSHMATQVNVPGMQQKRKTAKPLTTVGQDEFDNDEEM